MPINSFLFLKNHFKTNTKCFRSNTKPSKVTFHTRLLGFWKICTIWLVLGNFVWNQSEISRNFSKDASRFHFRKLFLEDLKIFTHKNGTLTSYYSFFHELCNVSKVFRFKNWGKSIGIAIILFYYLIFSYKISTRNSFQV